MIDVSASTVIPRPVEEVFEYVATPEYWPRWQHSVKDVQRLNPGPDGAGSRYHYEAAVAGHNISTTMTVTEFRPHEEIAFQGDWAGPVQPAGRIRFEPDGKGTRVTFEMRSRTRGAYRFAERKIASVLRSAQERGLERLKSMLTSGEGVTGRA